MSCRSEGIPLSQTFSIRYIEARSIVINSAYHPQQSMCSVTVA